jgi:hypothetical protein
MTERPAIFTEPEIKASGIPVTGDALFINPASAGSIQHQENDKNNQTGEKLRHHIMLHLYPDPHPSLHFQYINL